MSCCTFIGSKLPLIHRPRPLQEPRLTPDAPLPWAAAACCVQPTPALAPPGACCEPAAAALGAAGAAATGVSECAPTLFGRCAAACCGSNCFKCWCCWLLVESGSSATSCPCCSSTGARLPDIHKPPPLHVPRLSHGCSCWPELGASAPAPAAPAAASGSTACCVDLGPHTALLLPCRSCCPPCGLA